MLTEEEKFFKKLGIEEKYRVKINSIISNRYFNEKTKRNTNMLPIPKHKKLVIFYKGNLFIRLNTEENRVEEVKTLIPPKSRNLLNKEEYDIENFQLYGKFQRFILVNDSYGMFFLLSIQNSKKIKEKYLFKMNENFSDIEFMKDHTFCLKSQNKCKIMDFRKRKVLLNLKVDYNLVYLKARLPSNYFNKHFKIFTQLSDSSEINPFFINLRSRSLEDPEVMSYLKGDYYVVTPGEESKNGCIESVRSVVFEKSWNSYFMHVTNTETGINKKMKSDYFPNSYHSLMNYFFEHENESRDGKVKNECYLVFTTGREEMLEVVFLKEKTVMRTVRGRKRKKIEIRKVKTIDKVCKFEGRVGALENCLIGNKIIFMDGSDLVFLEIVRKEENEMN